MRIEHIALYVNDLEAAREFYCRYFGGQSGERYHNPKTGFQSFTAPAATPLMMCFWQVR